MDDAPAIPRPADLPDDPALLKRIIFQRDQQLAELRKQHEARGAPPQAPRAQLGGG
jgi:hypothetical protein